MTTRRLTTLVLAILTMVATALPTAFAAEEKTPAQVLVNNVNIFDGSNKKLAIGMNVLVEGNKIKTISKDAIPTNAGATVIAGGGRTLMPGMIDGHVHLAITRHLQEIKTLDTHGDIAIRSTVHARRALMDGFTTVRDVGGPVFALKRAVDAGLVVGPRIYPSGGFVSQTSGHGDFGDASRPNPSLHPETRGNDQFERLGLAIIADGVPAVQAAVRQNLRQGASQVKVMGGGGGSSPWDPIDTTQYSVAEWEAAVEAAADWGTYITSHIFTDRAVKRAVAAGVKSLDHAFFMSEEVIEMVADKGVFVGPQMWGMSPELFKNPSVPKSKHAAIKGMQETYANFAPWLLKHKAKVFFASDLLGPFDNGQNSRRYELWWRTQAFGSNHEVLKQATSVAGELMALSGPRNPYPGKLGVIEEGALADILIIDGNPLKDIAVLGAQKEWFEAPAPEPIETMRVIMKDGVIYKNTL